MSGPLTMTASQVDRLGRFLREATALTKELEVRVEGYGSLEVLIDGSAGIGIEWDGDLQEYVVRDQVGR